MKPIYRLLLALGLLLQTPDIFAQIHAAFTSSTPSGCSPLVVTFTDQSTGTPNDWYWDFGNGNTSISRVASAAYLTPGQYTVKLIARSASGADSIVKTNLVTVYFQPVAAFRANDTIGCAPRNVQFTDLSAQGSAAVTSWTWDFGDGTTSNLPSPQHTYSNPGTYGVVLLVKDANGCTDRLTKANYEQVIPLPAPAFTVVNTTVCGAPHDVVFNNTTAGAGNTYFWDFGDSTTSTQTSPQHTYANSGNFTIKLTATSASGCAASVIRNNYINVVNYHADFTVDRVTKCVGDSFHLTDQSSSTANRWNWDLDAGRTSTLKNPNVAYATPGNYTIKLISSVTGGCTDSITKVAYLTVTPSPVASFTADTTHSCSLPFLVHFSGQPLGMLSYTWDFGNGGNATGINQQVYYSATGSFTVKLIVRDSNGCANTMTKPQYIVTKPPRALFMAPIRKGCAPLDVSFINQTLATDSIVAWKWEFGDNTTSIDQSPTHTYADTGFFTVKLIATNAHGCVDTFTQNRYVKVGQTPIVNFDADPKYTCAITPIHFTDSTSVGDEWLWNFGDGGTAIQPNPIYHYSDTGLFSVQLIVGNNGCYDTLLKPQFIQIFPPIAKFTQAFNCADPFNVAFTNTSAGGNKYSWLFGDGDSSNIESPTHIYSGSGSYTINLLVTDTISGCIDSTSATIKLTHPVADFTVSSQSGCKLFNTTFHSNSTDAASYSWTFGDGTTPDLTQNPSHIYVSTGQYTVRLTVTDINHCVAQATKTNFITVHGIRAAFGGTPTAGCAPLTVNYTDSSSSFMGTANAWKWKFGNGDSSSIQNPSSIYTLAGSYTAALTVTDNNGCVDSVKKVNYINPTKPKPAFSTTTRAVCLGSPISFVNQSNGIGLSHHWDFGDGDTLLATSPTHTYRDTGYYTVSLRLVDINGCDSTLTKTNYIHVMHAHAKFVIDTNFALCPPLTVHFTDQSYDSVTRWMYNFGDGQTSSLKDPAHIYTTPGTYHPWLIATNYLGCSDTIHLADSIVIQGPRGSFTYSQPSVCIPFGVTFISNTSNNVASLIWDYGDGVVLTGSDTTIHQYSRTGVFNPVLIIQDSIGCTQSIPAPNPIRANTSHAAFTSNTTSLCGSGNVTFTDQSTAVPALGTCTWYFGDGTTSALRNPVHTYTNPGTYTVKLVSRNSTGCTDTIIKPALITVYAVPHASFTASDSAVCLNTSISFTDNSHSDSSITSRTWNFGDGTISLLPNPSHTFATSGTFTVKLVTTTVNGCNDTARKTITIYALPIANAGSDRTICLGDTVHMTSTGGIAYLWSPATGLSNDSINNPIANSTATNSYAVTVTDIHGCKAADTMTIKVNGLPVLTTSNDTSVCPGLAAQINVTGAANYQWSPATGLSSTVIANPIVNATTTTNYLVLATDSNGCKARDSVKVTLFAPAVAVASSDTSICPGFNASLHASGGTSYTWSPATYLDHANIANPITSPAITTMYRVQVTDSNGCIATDSLTVTVFAPAVAVASHDTSICADGSAQLLASGGVQYVWSPATNLTSDTVANPIATPTITSTYVVRVTDANGCKANDTVSIQVNKLPIVTTSNDTTVCPNNPTRMWAAGGSLYQWSPTTGLNIPTSSHPIANITTNTNYIVVVTDSNGCQATDSVHVSLYAAASVTVSNDTAMCVGDPVQLVAAGGVTYRWSPAAGLNNPNISNPISSAAVTTLYKVQVTTINGCRATDSVNVTVNQLPAIKASNDTAICYGNAIQLAAQGGTTYLWSPGTGLSNANIANPVANVAASSTYIVRVTDANGCKNRDTVNITVNSLPVVHAHSDPAVCNGDTISLHATGTTNYSWTPGTALNNAHSANPIFTADVTRTYTVVGTDNNGCSATDSISITVKSIPVVRINGDTSICLGDTAHFSGAGDGTLSWSPAAEFHCNNCNNVTVNPTTTTTYTLTVSAANQCSAKANITTIVRQLPTVKAPAGTRICSGETVGLITQGSSDAVSYAWTPAGTLDDSTKLYPTATPTSTTKYQVTAYNEFGCAASDTVTIVVDNHLALAVSNDATICAGTPVTLTSTATTINNISPVFTWLPTEAVSDVHGTQQSVTPLVNTTYTVIVTEGTCKADTQQIHITVNPLPTVELGGNQVVFQNQQVYLHATTTGNVTRYEWEPIEACHTCADVHFLADKPSEYTVTVTDDNGCKANDNVKIKVIKSCEEDVFLPNTFTPNNDGTNDNFYVRGNNIISLKSFRVFDRWGKMVFETSDINQGWNGLINGTPATIGVYVYHVEGICRNGGIFVKKGNVTLLK